MDTTSYRLAVAGFSSTLTYTTVILSEYSAAICSTTGDTALHGRHHAAQKSTSTVLPDRGTSDGKVTSVTSLVQDMMNLPPFQEATRPWLNNRAA